MFQNFTLYYWVTKGADPRKLVMGMPMYGQSFSLASSRNNGLNAPTYGGGEAGEATRSRGFLSYYEVRICNGFPNGFFYVCGQRRFSKIWLNRMLYDLLYIYFFFISRKCNSGIKMNGKRSKIVCALSIFLREIRFGLYKMYNKNPIFRRWCRLLNCLLKHWLNLLYAFRSATMCWSEIGRWSKTRWARWVLLRIKVTNGCRSTIRIWSGLNRNSSCATTSAERWYGRWIWTISSEYYYNTLTMHVQLSSLYWKSYGKTELNQ